MKNLYKLTILLIALTFSTNLLFAHATPRIAPIAPTATPPSEGDGSSGTPYQIASLENLYWITASDAVVPSPNQVTRWTKYYIQTADINASATSGWDGGSGWTPIGNGTTSFTGSYNGQGHTIDGLYINRPSTDDIGLFGITGSSTIQNLGVTAVNITGKDRSGGLVGKNQGTISNSYITGSVSGGSSGVGGLVGYHLYSNISNSYNTGSVSGGNAIGGLVGNQNYGVISNSYSTGSVNGSGSFIGGFVGMSTNGTVSNCYSSGSVSGGLGFSGYNTSTISNSFWDTETSGQATSSGGTGKTTAEMKTLATFTATATVGLTTAWDFVTNPNDDAANNDYWDMDLSESINNGYPFLGWQNGGESALPVELTSFSASVNGGSVVLNWQTATEVNNYGFEIEKAVSSGQSAVGDGSLSWSKCGFVQGNGNSNSAKEYTFTDEKISNGKYSYRLKQIDNDGKYEYSKEIEIDVDKIPTVFALAQNYPNPFNPVTTISYSIAKQSNVKLIIYDALGREKTTLVNEEKPEGIYTVEFNAANFTSGVYFYRMQAGNFVETKKLLLIK